ncbi:MAG: anti-sigma factor antagonist [Candidatus Wallbacteria bacterium]|nr:anti-sigma factor antagonist [Candidatus Wallbacteria bacterium]
MNFNLTTEETKGILIVHLSGEVNPGNEDLFQLELEKVFSQASLKKTNIILSFRELEYINSTGLGVITHFYRRCNEASLKVMICSLNRMCTRLFEITKMNQIFEISSSLDKATAELEQ